MEDEISHSRLARRIAAAVVSVSLVGIWCLMSRDLRGSHTHKAPTESVIPKDAAPEPALAIKADSNRSTLIVGICTFIAVLIQAFFTVPIYYDSERARMALVTATTVQFENGKPGYLGISFPFENSGDTPPKELKWYADYNRPLFGCSDTNCPTSLSNATIGPHNKTTDWHSWLEPTNIVTLKNAPNLAKAPEVWGWIAYKDVDGDRHRTFFCFSLQWDERAPSNGMPYYVTCGDKAPCIDEACNTKFYDDLLGRDWSRPRGNGHVPQELYRTSLSGSRKIELAFHWISATVGDYF
jgi:hypothetical protein